MYMYPIVSTVCFWKEVSHMSIHTCERTEDTKQKAVVIELSFPTGPSANYHQCRRT